MKVNQRFVGGGALLVVWMAAACESGLPDEKADPENDDGSGRDERQPDDEDAGSPQDSPSPNDDPSPSGPAADGPASGGNSSGDPSNGEPSNDDPSNAGTGGAASEPNGGGGAAGSGAATDVEEIEWTGTVVVDPTEAAEQPGLALDADGNAWALWNHVQDEYSQVGEVHVRRYDSSNDAWEDAIILDDERRANYHLTLGGSENGDAVAAWAKATEDDPDSLTIRAAHYSADDDEWSGIEELATINRWRLGGIRIAVGAEGTAIVGWTDVFIDNLLDEDGLIEMSRVRAQLVTRWFDGQWNSAENAVDVLTPEAGTWSDDTYVADRLPATLFDLALEDEGRARALVAWNDGVRAVIAENGQWSEATLLTDLPGGPLDIERLSSGDALATFVADGSLYSSTSVAGDPDFSEPELLEHSIDGVGSVNLAAAPEAAPIAAAVTWLSGDSVPSALVAARRRDGSWSEGAEVYQSSFVGYPRIGISNTGRVLVGGGDTGLWAAASPDGESWPSSDLLICCVRVRSLYLAVSPSGLAMFLWADGGGSGDDTIDNHLLAMVGK